MPLYLIALGVKHNRFRRVARLLECKDLDAAVQRAEHALQRAQHIAGVRPTYDTWTVSERSEKNTARILATRPDDQP